MDRELILEHLAQAERHITESDQRIARQRMLLERLGGEGADSTTARILLLEFEHSRALHQANWQRLQGKLHDSATRLFADQPLLSGANLPT